MGGTGGIRLLIAWLPSVSNIVGGGDHIAGIFGRVAALWDETLLLATGNAHSTDWVVGRGPVLERVFLRVARLGLGPEAVLRRVLVSVEGLLHGLGRVSYLKVLPGIELRRSNRIAIRCESWGRVVFGAGRYLV